MVGAWRCIASIRDPSRCTEGVGSGEVAAHLHASSGRTPPGGPSIGLRAHGASRRTRLVLRQQLMQAKALVQYRPHIVDRGLRNFQQERQ